MADRLRLIERRDVDELIILDITPQAPRYDELSRLCDGLFCPVTVGGGVRNIGSIRRLLAGGADKVALGPGVRARPELISDAAAKFGSQCVVVSIEAGTVDRDGKSSGGAAVQDAILCERHGAGEILINSTDRDGTMTGYDLPLIREVSEAVSIPVIACGGCGSYEHMAEALRAGAHAVAAGAAFQFLDMTPKGASRYLAEQGIPTRI